MHGYESSLPGNQLQRIYNRLLTGLSPACTACKLGYAVIKSDVCDNVRITLTGSDDYLADLLHSLKSKHRISNNRLSFEHGKLLVKPLHTLSMTCCRNNYRNRIHTLISFLQGHSYLGRNIAARKAVMNRVFFFVDRYPVVFFKI